MRNTTSATSAGMGEAVVYDTPFTDNPWLADYNEIMNKDRA